MIMVAKFEKKGRRTGTKKRKVECEEQSKKTSSSTQLLHSPRAPARAPAFLCPPARHPQPGVARALFLFRAPHTKPTHHGAVVGALPAARVGVGVRPPPRARPRRRGRVHRRRAGERDRLGPVWQGEKKEGREGGEGARRGKSRKNTGKPPHARSKRSRRPAAFAFPGPLPARPCLRAPKLALARVWRGRERGRKKKERAQRGAAAPASTA